MPTNGIVNLTTLTCEYCQRLRTGIVRFQSVSVQRNDQNPQLRAHYLLKLTMPMRHWEKAPMTNTETAKRRALLAQHFLLAQLDEASLDSLLLVAAERHFNNAQVISRKRSGYQHDGGP